MTNGQGFLLGCTLGLFWYGGPVELARRWRQALNRLGSLELKTRKE